MGIYSTNNVFGIKMYRRNVGEDECKILLYVIHNNVMTLEQMNDVYTFYTNLHDKNNVKFQLYSECWTTLSEDTSTCKMYLPITLESFVNIFGSNITH